MLSFSWKNLKPPKPKKWRILDDVCLPVIHEDIDCAPTLTRILNRHFWEYGNQYVSFVPSQSYTDCTKSYI